MSSFDVIQLRHRFKVYSGSTPESGKGNYWDGDIFWVTPEDVSNMKSGYRLADTKRKITQEGYKDTGVTMVPVNSIVLTKRAPIGLLALLDVEACSNQGCFLLVPKENVVPEFYYYYLLANKDLLQILGRGSTFMELSLDEIKSFKVPNYSVTKQKQIVNYLDRELLRIGTLIKKKEQQLELLVQQRKSLITQVVFKGLDANVPTKPSGIDYLGEIPEHWGLMRLGMFGTFSKGGGFSKADLIDEGCHAIIYGDIYTRYHIAVNQINRYISSDVAMKAVSLEKGDLLFTGSGETVEDIGKCVVNLNKDQTYAGGDVIIYRQRQNDSLYLSYVLNTEEIKFEKAKYAKGGIIVHIYGSQLKNIYVPLPPYSEQQEITLYLKNKLDRIGSIEKKVEESIALLNKRQVVLITEAVTSQLETIAS